jgi:hypothetical protein
MSNSHESAGGREYTFPEEALTTEEQCLRDLFDLDTVDRIGKYQPCSEFFVALNGQPAPEGLGTSIRPHRVNTVNSSTYPGGADVVATVTVGFDSEEDNHSRLHNIDFVRTDDGLKVFEKNWFIVDDKRLPQYVKELSEAQLTALAADAATTIKTIQEIDAERLKLGPLTEEAGPDGIRRFHVGDILSVITGRMVSPRGMEGIYDILGYMTNDSPYTTQLGRFAEECKPHLRQQVDEALAPFYEPSEEAMASTVSAYKWLGEIGHTLGGLLLTIKPVAENDHVVMNHVTELELDHGSEFVMKKLIIFDPESLDTDEG